MTRNLILYALMCILSQSMCAQTDHFRVLGGIPQLPVFSATTDITSPAAGMFIYSTADASPMLYNGAAWEGLSSVSAPTGGPGTFQAVDKIPYLPVRPSVSVTPTSGSVYYSSTENAIKVYTGSAWVDLEDLSSGTPADNAGYFSSLKEMIQFPVLSADPSPTGLSAGALYISSTDKSLRYYDGAVWQTVTFIATGTINGSGGTTLTFMLHNLGADTDLDPFTYVSMGDAVDNDIKGYLYQWGRKTDGHESRGSATTSTLATNDDATSPPGVSGNFITPGSSPYDWRSPQNDALWGSTKTANDPCPSGFRLPTQPEWQAAYDNNTWIWDSGNPGYKIDAGDGGAPELYLPAAGIRSYFSGSITLVNSNAYYWSSTVNGVSAYNLLFNNVGVYPNYNSSRAYGHSVRCIAE